MTFSFAGLDTNLCFLPLDSGNCFARVHGMQLVLGQRWPRVAEVIPIHASSLAVADGTKAQPHCENSLALHFPSHPTWYDPCATFPMYTTGRSPSISKKPRRRVYQPLCWKKMTFCANPSLQNTDTCSQSFPCLPNSPKHGFCHPYHSQ